MSKYTMTLAENIFYAKRNIVDSIWKEANVEGISVTFPETNEIFEGRTVDGIDVKSTIAINNLKHAWMFILKNINEPVDLAYIRQVNHIVGDGAIIFNAGSLRTTNVSIGGTTWKPEMPDFDKVQNTIKEINNMPSGEEKAIAMFLFLCRSQLFNDGNKRTAQIIANKMLISDGAGILAIPIEHQKEFSYQLVNYYETNNPKSITDFLVANALDGMG